MGTQLGTELERKSLGIKDLGALAGGTLLGTLLGTWGHVPGTRGTCPGDTGDMSRGQGGTAAPSEVFACPLSASSSAAAAASANAVLASCFAPAKKKMYWVSGISAKCETYRVYRNGPEDFNRHEVFQPLTLSGRYAIGCALESTGRKT